MGNLQIIQEQGKQNLVTSANVPKFLDWIQMNPQTFNEEQKIKQDNYQKEHGKEKYWKVIRSDVHNDLKASRTHDFSLTQDELGKLKKDGIYIKQVFKASYAQSYLNLYNND